MLTCWFDLPPVQITLEIVNEEAEAITLLVV
jgi:hypothetical protein